MTMVGKWHSMPARLECCDFLQSCHVSSLRTVTASASTSSIFLIAHMRRCPCQPINGPWWHDLQRAQEQNHCPCLISWQSLGPGASHTEHGSDFTRSMCVRWAAVGAFLFLLCIWLLGFLGCDYSRNPCDCMKSTGCLACFFRLHAGQRSCRFTEAFVPPRARGMM